MVNLSWVKERLIIFLLILLIFLPPTFLVGGYTFSSLTLIETLVLLSGVIWSLGRIKIIKSFINLPILFYLVSCVLSIINSEYLRGTWEEIIKLASCILLFLMIGNYFSTRLKLLIHTFIFTTATVISLSLIYFFTYLPESLNARIYFPLANPNILAGFLVITIPLMIRMLWTQRILKCLSPLLLLSSFIILYFTYSRGGILGVIGAILFLFFINLKNIKQSNRYILILIPCGLLIGGVLLIIYNSIFLPQGARLDGIFERLHIWKYSWRMFLDHPILGVGLGAYPNIYFNYKQEVEWYFHSHNIFIQHACEVGIIGLLSFIWLLIALFKENFSQLNQLENTYEKAVKEGLLASLIGFLVHNQVDYLLWIPIFQLYFWMIVGILSSISVREYILLHRPCWFIGIIIVLFWCFCILKPFLGYTAFNQGVKLADKGNWEEAKIKFEEAVLFDFYHPVYHAHLGITYTKIHPPNLSSAIKEYEKVTQLDNSNIWKYKKEKFIIRITSPPPKISALKSKKEHTLYWKLYRRMPMRDWN